ILVPFDDSEPALAALRLASKMAGDFGAHTTVYHGFRPVYLNIAESVSGMAASKRLRQEQLKQAEAWVEEQVRDVPFAQDALTVRVSESHAVAGLIGTVRGCEFHPIVAASRGAGGGGRLRVGSVADSVLLGACCPVLVVRSPMPVAANATCTRVKTGRTSQ